MKEALSGVGIVVIGRNEGDRLRRCLDALPEGVPAVYVDSASVDGSSDLARRRGLTVVELDTSIPLSAARARNEGFERLTRDVPHVGKVQFLDGDSTLAPGWLERATRLLDSHPELAAVHGRLHEVAPERSVFNRLCDIEWNQSPPGESGTFGGNVMVRVDALRKAGLWNSAVIAAEDDELCIRLRESGRVVKLDADMAGHDAAMTRVDQWWRRAVRCGHAYAQVENLHGRGKSGHFVRERRRALVWGVTLPAVALGLGPATLGLSLGLLGLYPAQAARIAWRTQRNGVPLTDAIAWGVSCTAARFAEAKGLLLYYRNAWLGRHSAIIEHKDPG